MKQVWDRGEIEAIEYLKSLWFSIKDTNFKFSKFWEIDIVGEKDGLTVFFEVKKRYGHAFGYASETLQYGKKIKILKTIQYYCYLRKIDFGKIRFDFLAIQDGKIEHFENVELY